jgi:NADPH:quinone reductase
MKAAYIQQTGPAENILFGELPTPRPTGSQVLVKIKAVSVNPIDTYVRSGLVPMPLTFPFIPGCDLAGVVEALGPEAASFRPGDRVWGSNQGLLGRQGTCAEYAAVEEGWLHATPESVSDEDAAAMALVGITAHLGLVRTARLRKGETLFVNGGSGGVGSTVIQMAKNLGARVMASAGSDAKVKACLMLGADRAINYRTQDIAATIKDFSLSGVNVWFETTREPDFQCAVGALTQCGRLILVAGREATPPFPVGPFYVKGCSMHGYVMFMASPEEQQACAVDINRWLVEGRLKPKIDRVLSLAETATAHRLQEENTIRKAGTLGGKIVLKP